MSRRSALSLLVAIGMVAASCRSGQSLTNAGIDRPSSATVDSLAPGETAVATLPPTTLPRKLDSLPPCDMSSLDKAATAGPVPITFWHGVSNELGAELERLTAVYNRSQNKVKVNLEYQGGYEQTIDKYLQSNTANRPDMVMMPEYMVQQMIDTKSIVPTEACADSAAYDMSPFLPQALGAYATEGVQWSMPFNMSLPVLYFLKPRLVAAGLDPDNPPRSLEDLLAASKQIVASGASTYSLSLDSDFDGGGGWYIEQWLSKAQEFYSDNENGRAAPSTHVLYDQGAGVELLTYLQSLVTEGGAVYVGDNASGQDALLKLADAEKPASMTIATSAALGPILAITRAGIIPGISDTDVGVGFMPGPNDGAGALVGGASLYIVDGKGTEKAAAVWDFMTFLVSAASQSQWAAATGYVPIRQDALDLEPIKSLYVTDPRFKVAYDQLISSAPGPTSQGPVLGPLKQVRRVTAAAVAEVLLGGDPQTALTKAAQNANDLIANYNAQNR